MNLGYDATVLGLGSTTVPPSECSQGMRVCPFTSEGWGRDSRGVRMVKVGENSLGDVLDTLVPTYCGL